MFLCLDCNLCTSETSNIDNIVPLLSIDLGKHARRSKVLVCGRSIGPNTPNFCFLLLRVELEPFCYMLLISILDPKSTKILKMSVTKVVRRPFKHTFSASFKKIVLQNICPALIKDVLA